MEKLFNENRTYGIEIEAYNVDRATLVRALNSAGIHTESESYNHTTRPHWKVVSDASLMGQNSFEIVSPILKGQDGLDQITTVCRVLGELGAKVNRTCGLHVHHDAGDFKSKHFENLFILYKRAEETLDSVLPRSRRGNNNRFCQSLQGKTKSSVEYNRYHKLNLSSFHVHGTVEIRHHSGTVEAQKIINWVILTQRIVDHARSSRNRVKNIEKALPWGTLKLTLGFSRQIKKGLTSAKNLVDFFENRAQVLA